MPGAARRGAVATHGGRASTAPIRATRRSVAAAPGCKAAPRLASEGLPVATPVPAKRRPFASAGGAAGALTRSGRPARAHERKHCRVAPRHQAPAAVGTVLCPVQTFMLCDHAYICTVAALLCVIALQLQLCTRGRRPCATEPCRAMRQRVARVCSCHHVRGLRRGVCSVAPRAVAVEVTRSSGDGKRADVRHSASYVHSASHTASSDADQHLPLRRLSTRFQVTAITPDARPTGCLEVHPGCRQTHRHNP